MSLLWSQTCCEKVTGVHRTFLLDDIQQGPWKGSTSLLDGITSSPSLMASSPLCGLAETVQVYKILQMPGKCFSLLYKAQAAPRFCTEGRETGATRASLDGDLLGQLVGFSSSYTGDSEPKHRREEQKSGDVQTAGPDPPWFHAFLQFAQVPVSVSVDLHPVAEALVDIISVNSLKLLGDLVPISPRLIVREGECFAHMQPRHTVLVEPIEVWAGIAARPELILHLRNGGHNHFWVCLSSCLHIPLAVRRMDRVVSCLVAIIFDLHPDGHLAFIAVLQVLRMSWRITRLFTSLIKYLRVGENTNSSR